MQTQQRAKVMRLSWEIQRKRNVSRSKSLLSAWAIFLNEDITVYHLTKRYAHDHYPNKTQPGNLTLFNS